MTQAEGIWSSDSPAKKKDKERSLPKEINCRNMDGDAVEAEHQRATRITWRLKNHIATASKDELARNSPGNLST